MGGPGSGRHPRKLSLEDARVLDIGELTDAGAVRAFPRGEIVWREKDTGEPLALLAYRIASAQRAGPLLLYLYWPRADDAPQGDEVKLLVEQGQRHLARCPAAGCDRRVRRLYAPLGEELFLCRACHDLVYRANARERLLVREVFLPALDDIATASSAAGPLPTRAQLDDFGPQESRLACLRLRAAGLSLRQIAALVGYSKSSVGRFLAAGQAGIDLGELASERLLRSFLPAHPPFIDVGGGLDRHSPTENEERLLFRAAAQKDDDQPLVSLADYGRCLDSLRERGRKRLASEAAKRPKRRRRR